MNIRRKLLASYLALAGLGVAVVGGHSLWRFQSYVSEAMERDLAARTTALRDSLAETLVSGNRQRIPMLIRRNSLHPGIKIRLISPEGRLLTSSAEERDRQLADWREVPGVQEALQGTPASGIAEGIFARGDHFYHAQPVRHEGHNLGVLRVSVTLEEYQQQWWSMLRTLLYALGTVVILCGLASVWLSRSIGGPIRAMRNFAVEIGRGRFDQKLEVRRNDELGELAGELTRMGQQLAVLDAERRVFLANVAHELRTPVSNVSVTLEALSGGAAQEPELRERFLLSAQEEIGRLGKLIQDLLELGRLEAGVVILDCQPLELCSVIDRAVAALESRLLARELRVVSQCSSLQLMADPERLCQVLMNLLDNAIKHSAPGSEILILTEEISGFASIHVHNEGSVISEEDLARVFEQFYVADPSRAGRGVGLGLAIARRLTEAHGGSITAASHPDSGTLFSVHLPLVAPLEASPAEGALRIAGQV